MKKHTSIAVLAGAALVFGSIFSSCSNDAETKEVKVDKTYASAVTFTVKDDAAGTGKTVELSTTTDGATIHYTTDGATPTSGSATYSTAISVTSDTVIKALAVKEGIENSPISVANISIKSNTVTVYKDTENPIGSEITIGNTKYYVISNTLSSTKNASRAAVADETETTDEESGEDVTGLVDTGDEDTDIAIEKFASDVYVRKFLAEVGITKYLQVWAPSDNIKNSNATSTNDVVEFADKFPIYAEDKTTQIAEFRQIFMASRLIENLHDRGIEGYTEDKYGSSGNTTDKNTAFNAISEADLRAYYEPNKFRVTTYPANEKRILIEKRYAYDENGEVALTKKNLESTSISKDYQQIESGWKQSYVYSFDDDGYGYALAYNGSKFYSFQNADNYVNGSSKAKRRISVSSQGDPISGSTKSSEFKNQIDIRFGNGADNYDTKTPWIHVVVSGSKATAREYKIQSADLAENGNWLDTVVTVKKVENNAETEVSKDKKLSEVLTDDSLPFKEYITFSSGTKKVNDYTVPSRIYIRANYEGSENKSTSLNKDILKVTLVPDESITTGVVYKEINRVSANDEENVPAFVNIYSAHFTDIAAGNYTTSTPVYSVSFFNPANETSENAFPNEQVGAESDDYTSLATISDVSFAWGEGLAKIYKVTTDENAETPTYATTATLSDKTLKETTPKSPSTKESLFTGAGYKSETGKLEGEANSNDNVQYVEKDAGIAVLEFTVTAKEGKKLSLESISDRIYFNKSPYFYTVIETTSGSDSESTEIAHVDATTEKISGGSFSVKKTATADKPLTVKIYVRAQKNLNTKETENFNYNVVFSPITLTFKEVDSGVSN